MYIVPSQNYGVLDLERCVIIYSNTRMNNHALQIGSDYLSLSLSIRSKSSSLSHLLQPSADGFPLDTTLHKSSSNMLAGSIPTQATDLEVRLFRDKKFFHLFNNMRTSV